jgi:VWFA-related protein
MKILAMLMGIAAMGAAQQNSQQPADSGAVIRTETRVVLVDTVVTDKKGAYVRDLTAKDFKVWEDNKEQKITSFSFEADPAAPNNGQPHYLVLFFDNATMNASEQAQARAAAAKFVDSSAAPNRMIAVVNFTGTLQVTQNFTDDVEKLKAAVSGIKISQVSVGQQVAVPGRFPRLSAGSDFAIRDSLLAMRSLSKNLGTVNGRKTLVWFTAGYLVAQEQIPEVTATIDACNRANVAVYPIDVRGLVAGVAMQYMGVPRNPFGLAFAPQARGGTSGGTGTGGGSGNPGGARGGSINPGSGTGTGTGAGGRGATSTPGGAGVATGARSNPSSTTNNPNNGAYVGPFGRNYNPYMVRGNTFMVKPPDTATPNQEVMYMIADGTGGFVIVNTNDLLAGLEKIGKEQNEYYLIGYTPPDSEEGSCHAIKVKVDKGSTRARTGYCNAKIRDVLASSPAEKTLESRVTGSQAGNVGVSIQAPYFYTSANVARVNVAMEIAPDQIKFDKDKGKMRSSLNVLGIAYSQDGGVAARFSDTVRLEFADKKEVDAFKEKQYHYENQFDIAPGKYTVKIAFTAGGENFGKTEIPLQIEPYDGKSFTVSSLAFGHLMRADAGALDAALIEDRTPLVVQGLQIVPTGKIAFKSNDKPTVYVEIYEPLLLAQELPANLAVALQVRVLDAKSGDAKVDSGQFRIETPKEGGNPVLRYGAAIPIGQMGPGTYKLELSAEDSAGKKFKRVADFQVESN